MKAILAAAVLLTATGAARADNARVLVVPFSVLNVPESQQWIGRGVQENVVADFGRSGDFTPIAFQGQVLVEDNATAARLARNAQSPYAVRGAAQQVGGEIRITAQLIDAKTGDTLRTASVTGPSDNLLKMEDQLAAQLRGVATDPPATAGTATAAAPAAPMTPIIIQPSQPQVIVVQPQLNPGVSYSGYSYPYASNGYYPYAPAYAGYPYSPFYPGLSSFSFIQFIPPNRGHDHSHDHDHDHHPGNGGSGGTGITHIVSGGNNSGFLPIPTTVSGLTPTNYGGLTPTNFGGLTPRNFGGMAPTNFGGLTPTNHGGMTPTNAGGLTPTHQGIVPTRQGGLTPVNASVIPISNRSILPAASAPIPVMQPQVNSIGASRPLPEGNQSMLPSAPSPSRRRGDR
ncbi:MAG TPA: hypothetical protein VHM90_01345 [Phycisphaerae bacterium]|nr:hypothetical protein [Phycisphaerae bacterium]